MPPSPNGFIGQYVDNEITFFTDDWWDGILPAPEDDWSYQATLTHEMGHSMGLGHSGNENWSYDDAKPTMEECVAGQINHPAQITIEQDDYGAAAWIGGGRDYWTANPGFESGLLYFQSSNGVVSTSVSFTGSTGIEIPSSGKYVRTVGTYDPWYFDGTSQIVAPEMTKMPTLQVSGYYRHADFPTTGGVKAQFKRRFVRYSPGFCRNFQYQTTSAWSAIQTLTPVCGDPGTMWTTCFRGVGVDNTIANDATQFRAEIRSTSSDSVFVDKVGGSGGTP